MNAYIPGGHLHFFWTSGNDRATEGTFVWGDSNVPVRSSLWYVGEPNNWNGNENCASVAFALDEIIMNDFKCSGLISSVCEMRLLG